MGGVMAELKTMTTFRRADGELIWGEYRFVGEEEFFDNDFPHTEVVKETWVLRSSEEMRLPKSCDCCDCTGHEWRNDGDDYPNECDKCGKTRDDGEES